MTKAQPRSSSAHIHRRTPLAWPPNTPFKILSIDGGGIRGIYPASVLAELENKYLNGQSIGDYFDLVTGTSTGGIIALGLGAGNSASDIQKLYIERGADVFPRYPLSRLVRNLRATVLYRYSRAGLSRLLKEVLSNQKLSESKVRLCIPSFDGNFGEVYVFKTPHHPDYFLDADTEMNTVGKATSAAPTFFRSVPFSGYHLLDGGVWANNPIMVGLVDVLSCFDVARDQIRILSLSCGEQRTTVSRHQRVGGVVPWREIIFTAMDLQSQNATGQAGLLIGKDNLIRLAPKPRNISLDDWRSAKRYLPDDARQSVDEWGSAIQTSFLQEPARHYEVPSKGPSQQAEQRASAPDTKNS